MCIVSWNRPEDVARALLSIWHNVKPQFTYSILVLDNGSDEPYKLGELLPPSSDLQCFRSDTNLGPSQGRNYLLSVVDTPYALFLDDDCILTSPAELPRLLAIFHETPPLVAITADIWERTERGDVKLRTPAKRLKPASASKAYANCFGFIGGCFLADVEKMRSVDGFPREGFFGCEELALSHRLFAAGFEFGRSSYIQVDHLASKAGRLEFGAYGAEHIGMRVAVGLVYFRGVLRLSHVFSALALFGYRYFQSESRPSVKYAFHVICIAAKAERNYVRRSIRFRQFKTLRLLGLRAWV